MDIVTKKPPVHALAIFKAGTTFYWQGSHFMRLHDSATMNSRRISCACLYTGHLVYLDSTILVTATDTTLTVNNLCL